MKQFLLGFFTLLTISVFSQYAPPAGEDGSDAVSADSSIIIGWGDSLVVERGPLNIQEPQQGEVTFGTSANGAGRADTEVVSLGDGGTATYYFSSPLENKEGADFAVFENSFSDEFLELAFVEVSSDGENFVRFPAVSLTQTEEQVGSFGTLDATLLYNLAGKYRGGYGVPFNLEALADSIAVNINAITHIRIVDVVGTLYPEFATTDSQGNRVNDPYPTAFNSGGFDLDALAILDPRVVGVDEMSGQPAVSVYPNPASEAFFVEVEKPMKFTLYDATGGAVRHGDLVEGRNRFHSNTLKPGVYLLLLHSSDNSCYKKVVIR